MLFRTGAATGGTVALLAGLLGAAPATAETEPNSTAPDTGPVTQFAMEERDLSATEAEELLTDQVDAATLGAEVESSLGSDFGGSYVEPGTGDLVVNVTNAEAAAELPDGVTTEVVTHGEPTLNEFSAELDRTKADVPAEVVSWGPDVRSDRVVVTVLEGATDAAEEFVATA
ncbi:S1 family peptidase [Lipingzhangella sp. LS1_29]|uniref:S1 family peptidase n=1 Tax=Lipingzhangella rawalii TaxID=2055835 RepID=A0ABU2H9Z1_9ACTN|nr:S1 family peptidase [Lipingzhangella rawalii]MDS1272086.1 S1 family peptidase [Lipingzhangella rawalii]